MVGADGRVGRRVADGRVECQPGSTREGLTLALEPACASHRAATNASRASRQPQASAFDSQVAPAGRSHCDGSMRVNALRALPQLSALQARIRSLTPARFRGADRRCRVRVDSPHFVCAKRDRDATRCDRRRGRRGGRPARPVQPRVRHPIARTGESSLRVLSCCFPAATSWRFLPASRLWE